MKKMLLAFAAILVTGLFIVSCQKEKIYTSEQSTAEDIVSYNDLSEQIDADIDMQVEDNLTGAADDEARFAGVTTLDEHPWHHVDTRRRGS